jgi:hypothetical protein
MGPTFAMDQSFAADIVGRDLAPTRFDDVESLARR